MPKVTYVQGNDAQQVIDVPIGTSVMRSALLNGVDGIVGECGGAAMCATCHVYVEENGEATPSMEIEETEMLEFTVSPREANSRLSCQLVMTTELDGLVVRLPDAQV